MYDWVAQHPGGIIGVSITYRMGILGFLGGPEVEKDGDLNAGLLDQRAGLEWIQRHIAAFGGDPEKVTISGESAGGASVMMQVVAYGGVLYTCTFLKYLASRSTESIRRLKTCALQTCDCTVNWVWANNVP